MLNRTAAIIDNLEQRNGRNSTAGIGGAATEEGERRKFWDEDIADAVSTEKLTTVTPANGHSTRRSSKTSFYLLVVELEMTKILLMKKIRSRKQSKQHKW